MIPAFIFYKFLPSEAYVKGPLKGFKINLTGSFAGYFTLFLLVLYFPRPKSEAYELWTVKGTVTTETPVDHDDEVVVDVLPPPVEVIRQPGGRPYFMTTLLVLRKADGTLSLPYLRINRQPAGQFDPVTIPLDERFFSAYPDATKGFTIERDSVRHEIDITSGIVIHKANAAYAPAVH